MTEARHDTHPQPLEAVLQIPSYAQWPMTLVRGEDCRVWDDRGREYLDLYGGHSVSLIGHSHPEWVRAISEQAARLGFYSNVASNDVRGQMLERLVDFFDNHLKRLFLCNSGSEANETAIKLALKATGRTRIVAMEGGFHGRTSTALSLTSLGRYRDHFPSLVKPVPTVALGDLEALQSTLDADTAAVILEPVQSMNGMQMADAAYYPSLVRLCHANGTLVIFDEVQTGMGRLGTPLATHKFGAAADIVTLAKGIAGGFPMGAVATTEEVAAAMELGELGSTFGGGPLACAAALAVLEVLDQEQLVARAARLGALLRKLFPAGPVVGVRGAGLLVGLQTSPPAADVARFLRSEGILTGTSSDPHVLRLMPPLTLEEVDLHYLVDVLKRFPGGSSGEDASS